MRRSTPWTNIASARMKLPMNRKMIGSANGASAARASATRSTTARTGPSTAVAAMGSASETQSTTTRPMMAAMRWAGLSSGSGASQIAAITAGARNRPTVRRRRLNRSSAGEYTSAASIAWLKLRTKRPVCENFGPSGQRDAARRSTCTRWVPPGAITSTFARCAAMAGGGDRRRARPGARRLGGADAALPDANAHPVRRFDDREFDVGAIGKRRMVFERRPQPGKPRVVGQRTQHDALRVADGKHRGRHGLAQHIETALDHVPSGCPISAANRYDAPDDLFEHQPLGPGRRLDDDLAIRQPSGSPPVARDDAPPGPSARCRTAPMGCRRR